MTYEQFAREFWEHTKLLAFEPAFSMGELVLLLALIAYTPPWWVSAPLFFVWLLVRNTRRDSDTRPTGGDKGTLGSGSAE